MNREDWTAWLAAPLRHVYLGNCPTEQHPEWRAEDCPACRTMTDPDEWADLRRRWEENQRAVERALLNWRGAGDA